MPTSKESLSSFSHCSCNVLFPLLTCHSHSCVLTFPHCVTHSYTRGNTVTCLQIDRQVSSIISVSSLHPTHNIMQFKNLLAWLKQEKTRKSYLIRQEVRAVQMFSSIFMPSEDTEQPHHGNWEVVF